MADWSKPALASTYANFVTETNARDTDLAVMFDPEIVTPTNFPSSAIRWRSAANKWEKWNGTVWSDLATTYAINISGTAANVTGIVDEANGGTGQSGYTIGDLLYASGAAALSKLAAVATGNVLLSGGAATAPSWGKVDLTSHVSGILPLANGGTGGTTGVFATGTRMPFAQASAPVGWTQDTSDSATNRMLRVVNTAGGGIGGSHSPVLNNVVPSHTHTLTINSGGNHAHSVYDPGHVHLVNGQNQFVGRAGGDSFIDYRSKDATSEDGAWYNMAASATGISIYAGGDHTHTGTSAANESAANWTPRYIDMIICTKN